jgi:hypothetical protein
MGLRGNKILTFPVILSNCDGVCPDFDVATCEPELLNTAG